MPEDFIFGPVDPSSDEINGFCHEHPALCQYIYCSFYSGSSRVPLDINLNPDLGQAIQEGLDLLAPETAGIIDPSKVIPPNAMGEVNLIQEINNIGPVVGRPVLPGQGLGDTLGRGYIAAKFLFQGGELPSDFGNALSRGYYAYKFISGEFRGFMIRGQMNFR